MNVNLRKAAQLANKLAAIQPNLYTQVDFSIYATGTVEQVIDNSLAVLNVEVEKALRLTEAVYAIRLRIDEANRKAGVNSMLNERARVEKLLAALTPLAEAKAATDLGALQRKRENMLEAAADKEGRSYGFTDRLKATLNTAPLVEDYVRELRRRKIAVDDELTATNFRTEITLPDDVVELLRENDLI